MKDEDKAKAMKIEKLRKQAEDKTLPMEARNQLKDRANMLEQEMAKKAGVNMAKGGAVKKMAIGGVLQRAAAPRKQAMPAVAAQQKQAQMAQKQAAAAAAAQRVQAMPAIAAQQKEVAKPNPQRMAKGGAVKKGKK